MPYKLCLKRISHQVKYIFYDKIKDSIIVCIGNTAEDRSSLFLTWANRGEFSDTSFVHINVLHMPNTQAFHIRHGRPSAIICIKCLTFGSMPNTQAFHIRHGRHSAPPPHDRVRVTQGMGGRVKQNFGML